MKSTKTIASALSVLAARLALTACRGGGESNGSAAVPVASKSSQSSGLPQGSEPVNLNPADFTTKIDNPYWPMKPGSRWVYKEGDPEGTRQKVVIEVTDDWYAQDKQGNIWYLGEYVTNYENGKVVDHSGSFEAGVDGAQAGVAMPANPKPGMTYRQEYYKGEAEDKAGVITVGEEQVEVPFGYFKTAPATAQTATNMSWTVSSTMSRSAQRRASRSPEPRTVAVVQHAQSLRVAVGDRSQDRASRWDSTASTYTRPASASRRSSLRAAISSPAHRRTARTAATFRRGSFAATARPARASRRTRSRSRRCRTPTAEP